MKPLDSNWSGSFHSGRNCRIFDVGATGQRVGERGINSIIYIILLATVKTLSNLNHTPAGNPYYSQQTYDLLPYAGQTIEIDFSSVNDSSYPTDFRVDDVSVQVTRSQTKIVGLSGNLAFGNVAVNSSVQSTLTIANTGNATLTISSISYPSGFSGNWPGTIAPGGSQPVTVTFSPTSAINYGGTVTVNSDETTGATPSQRLVRERSPPHALFQ